MQLPIVLGSASPRRRDILRDLGLSFLVLPAHIDEQPLPGERPEPYLERIVAGKLQAVAQRLRLEADAYPGPFGALVVADTTVVVDDRIVGKPGDTEEAERIVSELAGRWHVVLTRYAVSAADDFFRPVASRTVRSRVHLRAADAGELRRYARSGEGLDKAGAYAIQGLGSFLVDCVEGSYSSVVGLPACELVQDLRTHGILGAFPHLRS